MPVLYRTICSVLAPRTKILSFLIALGTHPPLDRLQLARHLGLDTFDPPGIQMLQHKWDHPDELIRVGTLSPDEMGSISGGLLCKEVTVTLNRMVLENDLVLIVGPVFPHEFVGFSGGHKYFFPGISGPDMINQSHWLGALITNPSINGRIDNPVREMIEKAAAMVSTPRFGLSLVMQGRDLIGFTLGEVREAWRTAANLSSRTNVIEVDRPFHTVISVVPPKYQDLWTGSKCMTKLELVVADGGTLILYAPHIRQVSLRHGRFHREIGYHVADYFLQQSEHFEHVPRVVLADLMQLKGIGTYKGGVERPRIRVMLAAGIPESECQSLGLYYIDPKSLRIEEFKEREEEGILVVPEAGEVLWRLVDPHKSKRSVRLPDRCDHMNGESRSKTR